MLVTIKTSNKHLENLSNSEREGAARLLDKAAQICVSKHAGQRDKMGRAYFQHPMHVAMRCNSDNEKIVALLHDIEDNLDVMCFVLTACRRKRLLDFPNISRPANFY